MSIFVTRRIPAAGLEILRRAGLAFEVGQDDDELPLDPQALRRGAARHPVLLCQLTDRIDRELLRANPGLRGIAQMAVGVDNIDLAAARELGIPVGNTPGVLTEATADLAFALLLAVARRVVEGHRYLVEGRFRAFGPNLLLGAGVGPDPDGTPRTLGLVGFGRIGQAVARRAAGFGMRVLATARDRTAVDASPGVEFADLDALLAASDFVSLHVPLTAATRHLIDARALSRMRPGAFLINTARGPVVDEAALVEALDRRRIAGAGLDVYEDEPRVHPGLLGRDEVVLLPHLGSATGATRDAMAGMAARNALAFARGEEAPHRIA
jgi:glyoxylate reductase